MHFKKEIVEYLASVGKDNLMNIANGIRANVDDVRRQYVKSDLEALVEDGEVVKLSGGDYTLPGLVERIEKVSHVVSVEEFASGVGIVPDSSDES